MWKTKIIVWKESKVSGIVQQNYFVVLFFGHIKIPSALENGIEG